RAQAPPPAEIGAFVREQRCTAWLLDTYAKDGSTLLDWLSVEEIGKLRREAGAAFALAGSLQRAQIRQLRRVEPDWFAVRGAACQGGRRAGEVSAERVRQLVAGLARATPEASCAS